MATRALGGDPRSPRPRTMLCFLAVVLGLLATPRLSRHYAPQHALPQHAMTLTEPAAMRVDQLKAELASLGVSAADCFEKDDLVVKLTAARLAPPPVPRAVSFAAGLLKPVAAPAGCAPSDQEAQEAAESVLRRLRAAGVSHLAAVSGYMVGLEEDTESDLLREGDLLDCLLTASPTAEPSASPAIVSAQRAKDWVHVCSSVKELAGAKRVGARTLWLNAAAAADTHSREVTDEDIERAQASGLAEPQGYVARGIIADLADAVCAELEEIPAALVSLQAAALREREKEREKERVAAAEAVEAAGGAEAVAKAAQEAQAAQAAQAARAAQAAMAKGKMEVEEDAQATVAGWREREQYCISCGVALPKRARFCPSCGDELDITVS